MDAAKSTTGWLALLTTFVMGGASGYAARLGLEREPRREEEASNGASALEGMRAALAKLQRSVEELSRSQSLSPAIPPSAARESQEPEKQRLDLGELRELVARLEQAARDGAAHTAGLWIPEGRPQPLPEASGDMASIESLKSRYQFWTYQQALDAFGRPDNVLYDPTWGAMVLWQYRRDPDQRGWFTLKFYDGVVVGAESN